jgi:hypothetical protein
MDEMRNVWSLEIGKVFLAFGDVEYLTRCCLNVLPRDRIFDTTCNLRLAQRIDLILEILASRTDGERSNLRKLFLRAKALNEKRNFLAHNPLVFEFYEHSDGNHIVMETIVSLKKPDKKMSLDEVKEFSREADELVAEMYLSASIAFKELKDKSSDAS